MSTKNLSKTIIEGGRSSHNKWERRYSHKETRAHQKSYLDDVSHDLENYYEYDMEPTKTVYKGFTDKLNPLYRWLSKQVGLPWNDVLSKITDIFDTRTTAGRHVVNDHLLRSVEITPDIHRMKYLKSTDDPLTSYSKHDFFVDERGILCQRKYLGRRNYGQVPPFDTNYIATWLNGRIVGKVGSKLFWFVPADKNEKRGGYAHIWKTEWDTPYYNSFFDKGGLKLKYLKYDIVYKRDATGLVLEHGKPVELKRTPRWVDSSIYLNLRQDRKLSNKEIAIWDTFPKWYQTKVLELSPNYPNPPKKTYY